jgi:hypothetical protein
VTLKKFLLKSSSTRMYMVAANKRAIRKKRSMSFKFMKTPRSEFLKDPGI